MAFRRKVYDELLRWKQRDNGKTAVLLEGAKRVGKTTVVTEFAKNEYRSHILIDFSEPSDDIVEIFENRTRDLDVFFHRLQLTTGVRLHRRDSVIVFDEVQKYPSAREMIKTLVQDGRYDYIETGSLTSIKVNVGKIRIPSEEHRIPMYPMDFEEWLWANGDEPTMDILRDVLRSREPLGFHTHESLMEKFRTYLVVGGMPQVVDTYLETRDLMMAEDRKRDILNLYRDDMMKLPEGLETKTLELLDGIPTMLSSKKKTFSAGKIMKGARSRSFGKAIKWLIESKIVNPCDLCNDPDVTVNTTRDRSRTKLYMADTGLLLSLSFGNNDENLRAAYLSLLSGKLSINEGMFFENVAAQQLALTRRDLLFYEFRMGDSQMYEVDFILQGGRGIIPVEVKSSSSSRHKSLDLFMEKYGMRIEQAYVVHGKDLRVDGDVVYVPLYMAGLL